MTRLMIVGALLLSACTPPTDADGPDTLLLLDGYRDPADPCRRAGETPFTAEFLDHTADLVACPKGMENLGVFVTETGGVEVARTGGYILFSVPNEPV